MYDPSNQLAAQLAQGPDEFEVWLSDRPKWVQTAARHLIDNKRLPNEEELAALAALCTGEASGQADGYSVVVPGSLAQAAIRPMLRIHEVANVQGVNAIKAGASLPFGETNLAVVYGANGSGKTGFSRLLKQACGSRAKDNLLGNVFAAENPPSQAQIKISIGGKEHVIPWSLLGGPHVALRHVHVFDTKAAAMYMGKNEATYEPSRMRFISSLIAICDRVTAYLNNEKTKLKSAMPQLPPALVATAAAKWVMALKGTTTPQAIEAACSFPKELDSERVATEGALAQKNIAGRLLAIGQERAALQRVKMNLGGLKSSLADNELKNLVAARIDAASKRTAASEDARKVFANAPLDGVGQQSWMALWEQARLFSEQHAYPGVAYPAVDDSARCVLCQQDLNLEGKTRLGHFQSFVQGGLEARAKAAESLRDELLRKLPQLPVEHDWLVQVGLLKLPEEIAKKDFWILTSRKAAAETVVDAAAIPAFDWSNLEQAMQGISTSLEVEETTLKALQHDGKRKELEARLTELQGTQWLSQNKDSIVTEKARLASIALLDMAGKLANTIMLTRKNNELARLELDAGYQRRFADELSKLGGARLVVKPESKQLGKGRITFGLSLQGAKLAVPAESVLSEGETRIVALAAFLADITGSGQQTPFIFDDPISSLDQDFEERVVTRLVDLAKTRQVIVFTHRLSLLTLVETAVKKLKDQAALQKANAPVVLKVETLHRLGKSSGINAKLSMRDAKPNKAVARIRDEFLPQLRKHHDEANVEAYEERVKGVCSEFRILVERCVESVLLNEVLMRFRRDVQTKGRLGALAKIDLEDCALIDDLMTRYSVFEHSQSDELPAPIPDLDVLEADVKTLAKWITEFEARPAA